jgi:serine/threonine protein kinase
VSRAPGGEEKGEDTDQEVRTALLGQATGFNQADAEAWLVDLEQLEIYEEIGGGASAQVYRGAYYGQTVAIKRLFSGCLEQTKFVEFFGNEARLLATLHHPHVVRFYGAAYDPEEKRGLLVTELCTRGSLSVHLAMKNPRSAEVGRDRFFDLTLGISRALQFFHARQFVHRDLKPDNVLLDAHGVAKLCDFGLSRVIDSTTQANTMTAGVGTPAFMAIELIVGDMDSELLKPEKKKKPKGVKKKKKKEKGRNDDDVRSPSMNSDDDISYDIALPQVVEIDDVGMISAGASHAGTKVDVFSFAVMIWVLWTGEMPYLNLGLTPFTLMNKVRHERRACCIVLHKKKIQTPPYQCVLPPPCIFCSFFPRLSEVCGPSFPKIVLHALQSSWSAVGRARQWTDRHLVRSPRSWRRSRSRPLTARTKKAFRAEGFLTTLRGHATSGQRVARFTKRAAAYQGPAPNPSPSVLPHALSKAQPTNPPPPHPRGLDHGPNHQGPHRAREKVANRTPHIRKTQDARRKHLIQSPVPMQQC